MFIYIHFGIDGNDVFIPFDTTGTIVHFESRVPTDWEEKHLPILLLTEETWDPAGIQLGIRSREQNEMRTIRSLTSGMKKAQIASIKKDQASSQAVKWGQVEEELDKISPTLHYQTLCN